MLEIKNKGQKYLIKQFTIVNHIAYTIYQTMHNGTGQNFYYGYKEFEKGIFGWGKEASSFESAAEIYEYCYANEFWDIIQELEEEFGHEALVNLSFDEIEQLRKELADFEL